MALPFIESHSLWIVVVCAGKDACLRDSVPEIAAAGFVGCEVSDDGATIALSQLRELLSFSDLFAIGGIKHQQPPE